MPAAPATFDYTATLDRVVDGDTLKLTLYHPFAHDVGFGVTSMGEVAMPVTVRLADINAKPLKTPDGDAAKLWLAARLDGAKRLNVVTVKNTLGVEKHEKYGRWLCIIVVPGAVRSVNDELVAEGLAVPYDGTGPRD
jgi:endonuclease YncB( thermonuclease family)